MKSNYPHILFRTWYGEIKRFIRDDGTIKVSRSLKELNTKIREAQKHYLIKYGKEITIEELTKELKVPKEELGLIDRISTGKNEEELITNKLVVKELINDLETREKEVIMLRFYKEKTQSQVAKILGITQVQVSRIERKILSSMKLKLTSS